MTPCFTLTSRLLLALVLLLGTAANLPAGPSPNPAPVRTAAVSGPPVLVGFTPFRKGTGRTWVVRIAALGMALALFIIMRGSSRY